MKRQYVKKGIALLLIFSLLLAGTAAAEVDSAQNDDGAPISADLSHIHDDECTHEPLETGEENAPEPTRALEQTEIPADAVTDPDLIDEAISPAELMAAATFMGRETDDISYSTTLKDAKGRPVFLYAEFASGGYLIVLRTHKIPVQYSYNSEHGPYSDCLDKDNYYIGMLTYAYEEGGDLKLVQNNEVLSREDWERAKKVGDDLFDRLGEDFVSALATTSQESVSQPTEAKSAASSSVVIDNDFFSRDAPFAKNEDGDCGGVAAALLMRYYDKISPGLVNIPVNADNIHDDTAWKQHIRSR